MRIRFDRGTLVIDRADRHVDPRRLVDVTWDQELAAWRAPASSLAELRARLADERVRVSDEIRTPALAAEWSPPELRWYQDEALATWTDAGRRGVIALPTGSGKTVLAIAAIARLGVAALCLVPTRVLLDQWVRAIGRWWPHPVGRIGEGEHAIAPITVSTYASAVTWAPRIGDRFGLVVVDEAHHVGAWCPSEVLEMLVAPARLGLTATPTDGDAVIRHVGRVVYALAIEDLVGDGLAEHDVQTVPIALAPGERKRYQTERGTFAAAYRTYARRTRGGWRGFVKASSRSRAGREALAAWRRSREAIAYPAGKRAALRELLARHAGERTIVFTADNATAYAIARELLVPPITHEIGCAERADVIERFRGGEVSVLVSAQVLDEGFDVPDADVAIVVGGTGSARRHVQRIGRVLRPRDGKRARIYELVVEATAEITTAESRHGARVEVWP
jgi:superfamily II DNA or RNA helicase